jgi:catechol 2,3-dioxygenase-like lactoylglutathione lyase family enzyme
MKRIFGALVSLVLCAWAAAQNPPVRPSITGIAYVRIAVSDLENSRGFYEQKLGFSSNNISCHAIVVPCVDVNGLQRIEFDQPSSADSSNLVTAIVFATSSVAGLKRYLEAHGVKTGEIHSPDNESQQFEVVDPEHHRIAFVQQPESHSAIWSRSEVSSRLIHAGLIVHDRAAEDHFYKDILGFHVYWHGGRKDDETSWVDMQVPDGTDWIEYMLNVPANADKHTLGVMNHIALGVPDIKAAREQLIKNGWKPGEEPKIGRGGKWQLNLYDPDDTRIEFMEFTPVQKPCCSEYTGPHPKP